MDAVRRALKQHVNGKFNKSKKHVTAVKQHCVKTLAGYNVDSWTVPR